jgi:hypothetical protein
MSTTPPARPRSDGAAPDTPLNPADLALELVPVSKFEDESAVGDASASLSDYHLTGVGNRERALPIRQGDLTRLLLAEHGLSAEERDRLSAFGRILGAILHHEFFGKLRELKELYAPIDPDSDYVDLKGCTRARDGRSFQDFLPPFESALVRANYNRLDFRAIQEAVTAPNELGLTYQPDFSLFEHLMIYVRGFIQVERRCRNKLTRYRKRTVRLDAYQRLVVALKFKPELNLGPYVRSDVLYLKMFKDVPHVDMEMHLPEQGTKVRMRWIDKLQIAAAGAGPLALKLGGWFASLSPLMLGALIVAPLSAGLNSFFGFHRAKQRHHSAMIRSLYYLTLANNASVLTRLIDSAEDEEYKEAMLAYYFLWRSARDPEPCDRRKLDTRIESYLKDRTAIEVNFEVGDALNKLFRLGLARRDPRGKLHATPLDQALKALESRWHAAFPGT